MICIKAINLACDMDTRRGRPGYEIAPGVVRHCGDFCAGFPELACAANAVIVVQAWIDDNSTLILEGNTLQWTNNVGSFGGVYAAPGRLGGNNYSTIVSTSSNGAPTMSAYHWTPTWPTSPPDEVRYLASSSILSSLDPGIGDLSLVGFSWTGRGLASVVEAPSASDNFTTEVNFSDYFPPFGGAGWYGVTLIYGSAPLGPVYVPPYAPIPEPSTWAMTLLGFAALGFGAYRIRWRNHGDRLIRGRAAQR